MGFLKIHRIKNNNTIQIEPARSIDEFSILVIAGSEACLIS
jgi:hypothetical protein